MRFLHISFISVASAGSICSPYDLELLNGGRGLFDLIMSCAYHGEPALIRECVAPKLDALSLTSECGECTAAYVVNSKDQVGHCSAACGKDSSSFECVDYKEHLGFEWEAACSPVDMAEKKVEEATVKAEEKTIKAAEKADEKSGKAEEKTEEKADKGKTILLKPSEKSIGLDSIPLLV